MTKEQVCNPTLRSFGTVKWIDLFKKVFLGPPTPTNIYDMRQAKNMTWHKAPTRAFPSEQLHLVMAIHK